MSLTAPVNLFDCYKQNKNGILDCCRVCMCEKKDMKCVLAFGASRTVQELEYCTGVLINKEDGLPTKICDLCLSTLAIAHRFKKNCLASNEKFQELFEKCLKNVIKREDKVIEKIDIEDEEPVVTKQEIKIEYDGDDDFVEPFDFRDEDYTVPPSFKSKLKALSEHNLKITKIINNTVNKANKKIKNGTINTKTTRSIAKAKITCIAKSAAEERKNDVDSAKRTRVAKLECIDCNIVFPSQILLAEHKRSEAHKSDFICEICGKQFKYRSSHHTHIKTHFPPTHKCTYCEYSSCHKMDLKKHMRVHSEDKNYVCEYCTKSFRFVSNLHDHIRRHHVAVSKKHACTRCDRAFIDAYKLKRHLDTHDNIKRHECELCHAQFSRRCVWKKHLQKEHSIIIPRLRPGRQKTNFEISKCIFESKGSKPSDVKLVQNEVLISQNKTI